MFSLKSVSVVFLCVLLACLLTFSAVAESQQAVKCNQDDEGCPVRFVEINLEDWQKQFDDMKDKVLISPFDES